MRKCISVDNDEEYDEPSKEEMEAAVSESHHQRRGSDFDVLAHEEIESASIQDRSNNLYSTLVTSCGGTARQNLIKLHLAKREQEFTDLHPFTVLIGSWNVNGKLPTEPLGSWLFPQHTTSEDPEHTTENLPDIVAIGFQELDLRMEALVRKSHSHTNQWEERWLQRVKEALPTTGGVNEALPTTGEEALLSTEQNEVFSSTEIIDEDLLSTEGINGSLPSVGSVNEALPSALYYKVKHVRLVGIMLAVYALRKHKYHVRSVEASTHRTGMMGLMGNKGGVAVRLQFHHSTLCFVNSHLAAFQEQVERRNQVSFLTI